MSSLFRIDLPGYLADGFQVCLLHADVLSFCWVKHGQNTFQTRSHGLGWCICLLNDGLGKATLGTRCHRYYHDIHDIHDVQDIHDIHDIHEYLHHLNTCDMLR